MATISNRAIEVAKTISGNSPWLLAYDEAAGQTFKKGAYVTLNASAQVVEATSPNPVRILGIASEDAENLTTGGDSKTHVWIACDDTIFVGNISTTTAATDVGGRYGVLKNASSPFNWQVDKTVAVTSARVIVIQLDPRDGVGDTNARVHFIIQSSAAILSGTSPFI